MAKKIYLAARQVSVSPYGHLYFIIWDDATNTGRTVGGNQNGLITGGRLVARTDLAHNDRNNLDQFEENAFDGLNKIDISEMLGLDMNRPEHAECVWRDIVRIADGMDDIYYYDYIGGLNDDNDAVVNSNAFVLTILNALSLTTDGAAVNPLTLVNRLAGAHSWGTPGADGGSITLIGSSTPLNGQDARLVAASTALDAGDGTVYFVGRDNVNDVMIGTPGGDKYYGQQLAPDGATSDTVSYQRSDAGVTVTVRSGLLGKSWGGIGSGGHATGDTYDGIENFIGSAYGDRFNMSGDFSSVLIGGAGNDIFSLTGGGNDIIDGGNSRQRSLYNDGPAVLARSADGRDRVDYSGVNTAMTVQIADTLPGATLPGGTIVVTNDGSGGNDILVSIEKLKLGLSADTVTVGRGITQFTGVVIDGGFGTDTIDFSAFGEGVVITADSRFLFAHGKTVGAGIALRNFEKVEGTNFSDTISGPHFIGNLIDADPLVFDLDGDGIELTGFSIAAPSFDLTGDGVVERTGWVGADDGLLARDVNGNGLIDGISELFGTSNRSGFSALAALDSNTDGVVDANDTAFGTLRIWQDLDRDAVTDAGELKTLAEAGIASINLTGTSADITNAGNTITATGTYTRTDRTVRDVANVAFTMEDTSRGGSGSGGSGGPGVSGGTGRPALAYIDGGGGDDIIHGGSAPAEIRGGAGNDTIWINDSISSSGTIVHTGGNAGKDRIVLGAHNVLVADADSNDSLHLYNGNVELTGGLRFAGSETPWAIGSGMTRFAMNTAGDLVIRDLFDRWTFVANYEGGPGVAGPTAGIQVGDIAVNAWRLFNPEFPGMGKVLADASEALDLIWKSLFGEPRRPGADPLVFDLDGDGIELTAQTIVSPSFDLDGDGFAEPAGWVSPDDGFLARDLNSNGTIDDVSELFGNQTVSGFTELATLDSNSDGVIDVNDTDFGTLRIWRDLDQDARTDAGELQTLSQAGIASISLTNTPSNTLNANNEITATGTFTRTDRTTGEVADVVFRIDNFSSTYLGDSTVSAAAAALPELRGRGVLPSLRISMTRDAALLSVVTTTIPTLNVIDLASLRDLATPIFTAWAGASATTRRDVPLLVHTDANGRTVIDDFGLYDETTGAWSLASGRTIVDGNNTPIPVPTIADVMAMDPLGNTWRVFEGHHIAFMEKYLGEPVPVDQASQTDAAAMSAVGGYLSQLVTYLDLLTVRLALQGPLSTYLVDLEYDAEEDSFKPTTDRQLIPTFEAIFTAMPSDVPGAEAWLASWKPIIDVVMGDYDRGESHLMTSYSFVFANIVAASESVGGVLGAVAAAEAFGIPQGLIIDGTGTYNGTSEKDIFYLNAGDETVNGGEDHDAYVMGRNFGNDTIIESEVSDVPDIVRFADIASTEVTATRSGLDMIITVTATGDTLTIKDQFHGNIPGLGGLGWIFEHKGVAEIAFADGVVWDIMEMARQAATPLATADSYIGSYGFDVLDGGAGDDYLSGKDDIDIYKFGLGYGHDTIEDDMTFYHIATQDFLVFGAGITRDDLVISRFEDEDTVEIAIAGTTDRVTLVDQLQKSYLGELLAEDPWFDRIETFRFDDGSTMTWQELAEIVVARQKTAGNETIWGTDHDDTLDGGAGDDILIGGNGDDTYIFGFGYGNDLIDEQTGNPLGTGRDIVRFADDVAVSDVTLSRPVSPDREDLLITLAGGMDTLKINSIFTENWTFNDLQWIDEFQFGDGTVWTLADVRDMLLARSSTAGDDHIIGYYTADRLDGGAGNDRLEGGDGQDTYIFGRGYGHDVIYDYSLFGFDRDNQADSVVFGSGVLPTDVTYARVGNSDDIVLTITDTGETLTIEKQNNRWPTGPGQHEIEEIRFADNTVWTAARIRTDLMSTQATSGNDSIYGFFDDNVMDGGAGDDYLEGREGSDTYHFDVGYGRDTINDNTRLWLRDGDDKVVFGSGITTSNIRLARSGDDLVISVSGATDTLTIQNTFGIFPAFSRMDEFHFADGTVWSNEYVEAVAQGFTYSDVFEGTAAAETITGNNNDNTLIGHGGDDTLNGGTGSDTYRYASGDGNDVIDEQGYSTDTDRLVFTDLTAADLTFDRVLSNAHDLRITVNATGETITVDDHFYPYGNAAYAIEEIAFADATVWDRTTIRDNSWYRGTSASETITGTAAADTIEAGAGDDTLNGGTGSDTYRYASGDGNDLIDERGYSTDTDRLVFTDLTAADLTFDRVLSNAHDLRITVNATGETITVDDQFGLFARATGIEEIEFADQTVWDRAAIASNAWLRGTSASETINGTAAADTIEAGAGDDTLNGGTGSDTYRYASGDGNDVIDERGYRTDTDRLVFTDLTAAGLTFDRVLSNPDDLRITVNATGETITVDDQFGLFARATGIEEIEFADQTVWDRAAIASNAWLRGTSGDDTIAASAGADRLDGGEGNDRLDGGDGDDVIAGGEGNDRLDGGNRDDRLTGGEGNDTLDGGQGSDTYRYRSGDGNDVIDEDGASSDTDRLVFEDINRAGVSFARASDTHADMVITVNATGETILVDDQFAGARFALEEIRFADGTVIDPFGLIDLAAPAGTSGDDSLTGSDNLRDSLHGAGGDDMLNGRDGNDTYFYNQGGGDDTITEGFLDGTDDRLVLGSGILASGVTFSRSASDIDDVTLHFGNGGSITLDEQFADYREAGIEEITFADGTVWSADTLRAMIMAAATTDGDDVINGFDDGAEKLRGGRGDDTLNGRDGNDAYVYNLGDGNDVITEGFLDGTDDRLVLGSGILASGVTFSRSASDIDDVTLHFAGGGSVTLDEQFARRSQSGIEEIAFADGTVWSADTLRAMIMAAATTDGDDVINGFEDGAETLRGGRGDDTLNGHGGNDTYVYNPGDGDDVITEGFLDGTGDRLVLGSGITASGVTFSRSASDIDDVTLHFAGGGSVTLDEQFARRSQSGIEEIEFADGTVWSADVLRAMIMASATTDGDDVINGFEDGAETLWGGRGDDTLNGHGGNDTYVYNPGDGDDVITEGFLDGTGDRLILGTGILASGMTVTRSTFDTDDVTLHFAGGGSVTLDGQFARRSQSGIEEIAFADGTVWDRVRILSEAWFRGTTGDDTITASAGADRIDGGAGNDRLDGGDGDDRLIGGAGDDVLSGGSGDDLFVFRAEFGRDTVTDFSAGEDSDDVIEFGSITSVSTYARVLARAADDGMDTTITIDDDNTIVLQNVLVADLGVDDFRFA